MTTLDAQLKQAISDRCMQGSNVTLNSNLVIQLIEYLDKLEKAVQYADSVCGMLKSAGYAGKAEALTERIQRCIQIAGITNTCRVVNPQINGPVVTEAGAKLSAMLLGECDSLQSTIRTLKSDDLRDYNFVLDPHTNVVTMTNTKTGETSQHLVRNLRADVKLDAASLQDNVAYSMSAKVSDERTSAQD